MTKVDIIIFSHAKLNIVNTARHQHVVCLRRKIFSK